MAIEFRATLIRDSLTESRVRCCLHTAGADRNALNHPRHSKPFDDAPTPDLVLFDLADPDKRSLKILDQMKAEEALQNIACVLLTGPASEQMLEDVYGAGGDRVMFSPIELADFLNPMQSCKVERFLRALKVIENVGFVLVRVPATFMQQDQTSQPAAYEV